MIDSTPQHGSCAQKLQPVRYEPYYFKSKSGKAFALKIVRQQAAETKCSICLNEKISNISVCRETDAHVVCEGCVKQITTACKARQACPLCNKDGSLLTDGEIAARREQNFISLGRTDTECLTCHKVIQYSEVDAHKNCTPAADKQARGAQEFSLLGAPVIEGQLGDLRASCLRPLTIAADFFDLKCILSKLASHDFDSFREYLQCPVREHNKVKRLAGDMIVGSGRNGQLPRGFPYSWHSLALLFEANNQAGIAADIRNEHPLTGTRSALDENLASKDKPDIDELQQLLNQIDPFQLCELGMALGLDLYRYEKIPTVELIVKWFKHDDRVPLLGLPSWNRLANACKKIGTASIFVQIIKQHPADGAVVDATDIVEVDTTPDFPLSLGKEVVASTKTLQTSDHLFIARRLRELPNKQLELLAGILGLAPANYVGASTDEIIFSWLTLLDNVEQVGSPSWNILAKALKKAGLNKAYRDICSAYPKEDEQTESQKLKVEKEWNDLDRPLKQTDAPGLSKILRDVLIEKKLQLGLSLLPVKYLGELEKLTESDVLFSDYIVRNCSVSVNTIAKKCRSLGLILAAKKLEAGGEKPVVLQEYEESRAMTSPVSASGRDALRTILDPVSNDDLAYLYLKLCPGSETGTLCLQDINLKMVIAGLTNPGHSPVTWLDLARALKEIGQTGRATKIIKHCQSLEA